ncbi:MAG: hypothetical protein LLG01_15445 [Planctomycetaceae bacterium]|nr:hypothetical protein [Planctomycetaceae bacterium]
MNYRTCAAAMAAGIGFLIWTSAGLGQVTRPASPEITAALKAAGANAPQLQAALDKVPTGQREGLEFLIANMPPRDLTSLSAEFLLENVDCAYKVMAQVPWGKTLSKEMFLNEILPYACLNERRDNWRKDFYTRFLPLIKDCKTITAAAGAINTKVFPLLKVRYSTERAKPDQSPYESIASGKASCTGLAILAVDACRAVGIPARFVGTIWTDGSGNHSWLEVWDGGWHFTGAAEATGDKLDIAWFVGRAAGALANDPVHAIYASSFKRTPTRFLLSWAPRVDYVPAVNVTTAYAAKVPPPPPGQGRLTLTVVAGPKKQRVPAKLVVTDEAGKKLFDGTAKDERNDLNDKLVITVPLGKKYLIEASLLNFTLKHLLAMEKDGQELTLALDQARPKVSPRLTPTQEERTLLESPQGAAVAKALKQYFQAAPDKRGAIAFDTAADEMLAQHPQFVRKAAWAAYISGCVRTEYEADVKGSKVTWDKYTSPYVVRAVGTMPDNGWPLFIAMHGGGGAPQEVNDQQWGVMQIYYKDHPEKGGYLYLAIRAPTNDWNGFYAGYNLHLTEKLIRELAVFADIDPNKVYIMGYSHGGYGAFFQGMIMADFFAAVHASAAAPYDFNDWPRNLRNTQFTYMIGTRDTAYGRYDRNKWLKKEIDRLRGDRTDIYPVTMEEINHGHGGLPDRDKIADMYPHVRNPLPRHVSWTVCDQRPFFNWLGVTGIPTAQIDAQCDNNAVTLTSDKAPNITLLLDERLIDFAKPVVVTANGVCSEHKLNPSLKTLCETLQARGDFQYMFSAKIDLKIKLPQPATKPK